jgi:hypothetical protein
MDLPLSGNEPLPATSEKESSMSSAKDMQEAVEAELGFDPLVDATNITVKNLNGDVGLNGTVPSYPLTTAANNALRWAVTVPSGVEATPTRATSPRACRTRSTGTRSSWTTATSWSTPTRTR